MRAFVLVLAALLAISSLHAQEFRNVTCEGRFKFHLQGVCTNDVDAVFWCFTTRLVKTDLTGKITKQIDVGYHHGDLCFHDNKLYVAVNFGKFNDPKGNADSWVYIYDAADLSLLSKHNTPEVFYGAGGIAFHDGKFLVIGGLPDGIEENYAYEYDGDFKFLKKHTLKSGHTHLGIQTATFAYDRWWFGCYGDPKILLKADADLLNVERFEFDCSLGIVPVGNGRFLIGRGPTSDEKGCQGSLVMAEADQAQGLMLRKQFTLEEFRKKIDKALTPDQATALFGRPDRELGSGLIIYEYDLVDGTIIRLGFPGIAKIQYATHVKKDGTLENLLLK